MIDDIEGRTSKHRIEGETSEDDRNVTEFPPPKGKPPANVPGEGPGSAGKPNSKEQPASPTGRPIEEEELLP